MDWLLTRSVLIFGLTLAGGALPLLFGRTGRLQHLLVSLAAGIFLGAVFLHLVPEVAASAAHEAGGHGHGGEALWLSLMAGVLLLFFVEYLFLRGEASGHGHSHEHGHEDLCHEDHIPGADRHRMVGMAALLGLSLHAVADGLGLSAGVDDVDIRSALTMAIVSHKAVGGFSLAVALLLSGIRIRRVLLLVTGFALITPLAAWLRIAAFPQMDGESLDLLTAFAAGTFMYVALCDLLPEVFHERRDGAFKVLLVLGGVAISHCMHQL